MLDVYVIGSLSWLLVLFPIWMLIHVIAHQEKTPLSKISWSVIILIVPVIGSVLYSFIGPSRKAIKATGLATILIFLGLVIFSFREISRLNTFSTIDLRAFDVANENHIHNEQPPLQTIDNAATYYDAAIKSMNFQKSDDLKAQIKNVMADKWVDPSGQLLDAIRKNQKSIQQFRIGTKKENCDFYFGKTVQYNVERKIYQSAPLISISELVILNGKYLEFQGKLDDAVNLYLSLLRLAHHLNHDVDLTGRMVGIAVAKQSLAALDSLLSNGKLSPLSRAAIRGSLLDYKEKSPPAGHIAESLKSDYISIMSMLADGHKKFELPNGMTQEQARLISASFKKTSAALANQYYDGFIKASNSNSDADWSDATSRLAHLKNRSQTRFFLKASPIIYFGVTGNQEKYTDALTKFISETTLAVSFPNIKKLVEKHLANVDTLNAVIEKSSSGIN